MVKVDVRNVMKRAHELARQMEGDYRARMVLALRQAWTETRAPKRVLLTVRHQPSGGREWVARIVGRHPRYQFEREFLAPLARDWSSSGKTGYTTFELLIDGVYEVNEPYVGRRFVEVRAGRQYEIAVADVAAKIA
jgi:hypothetical protein